jgi:hypothetical protein
VLAQPLITLIRNNDTRLLGVDGGVREVLERVSERSIGVNVVTRTAGLPREHLVMAWKRVDLPTLARPTCGRC